jgi:hypothetical protein
MRGSVDVSAWVIEQLEAGGGGLNRWLRDDEGRRWLYKVTRTARHTGHLQGEDWAEKVVELLAALIGIPTARVELAHVAREDKIEAGVISLDLAGRGLDLQGGATLLTGVPGYRYRDSRGRPPKNHVGHNLPNVQAQFSGRSVTPPIGFEHPSLNAFDVFVGYLVLDAWVANQDRHEENWAVLGDRAGKLSLAPSFDHGASLGSILTDARRSELLGDPAGLRAFAENGRALKFEDGHTVQLVGLAADALQRATVEARTVWIPRLGEVSREMCATILADVPRLSDAARRFSLELLETNRRRLLDVC